MTGKVTIYFDGLCHLCSREVAHYLRVDREGRLAAEDIAAAGFDAHRLGLDPRLIQRELHVRAADGTLRVGVDAFIEIWNAIPRYRWAARWARRAAIRKVLRAGYVVFARVRPYLPRRPANRCETGTCVR